MTAGLQLTHEMPVAARLGKYPCPLAAWSRICVAGVSHLQFTSGASVEWTPGDKVKTCSEQHAK